MNIFLGHTTACLFWRTASQEHADRARSTRSLPSSFSVHTEAQAKNVVEGTPFDSMPLHVECAPQAHQKGAKGMRLHDGINLVAGYRKIARDIYLASPELSFIQMAETLSVPELALYGTELCARYVRDEYSATGQASREPLTSVDALRRALDSLGKFRGKDRARSALRAVCANTESPKESELAVLFSLFNQYGGYGLPQFECNRRIQIPKSMHHLTDATCLRTDFCWPEKKVAVEYDSDAFHTGAEKIAHDTIRRNVLQTQGYTVIGITRIQSNSPRELDRVVDEIKLALGARRAARCADYLRKSNELFRLAQRWRSTDPKDYHQA